MSVRRPAEPMREAVFVENVTVPANRARGLDADAVKRLAESMARIGLQTPISVRMDGDDLLLVAGLHRLEAARALGWEKIEAAHVQGDEVDARLWEIAENLHRAELSPAERRAHIAEWVRLTAERVAQGGPPSPGGLQPKEQGIRKAAKELGISRTTVQRAVAAAEGRPSKPAPAVKNAFESEEDWRRQLFNVWNRGAQDWRERALEALDRPVFDRTDAA